MSTKGLPQAALNVLAAAGIGTAVLARLDFASESVFVWTGAYAIEPSGTGDTLLDGNTFQPIANGVIYDVGSNNYSEQGSDTYEMSVVLPQDYPAEFLAASSDPNEYRTRPATIWRALMITPAGLATPAQWFFKRIRAGAMDQLEFTQDGTQSVVKLSIESHASYISQAGNSTWSDQPRVDPTDTSQNWQTSATDGQPIAFSTFSAVYGTASSSITRGGAFGLPQRL